MLCLSHDTVALLCVLAGNNFSNPSSCCLCFLLLLSTAIIDSIFLSWVVTITEYSFPFRGIHRAPFSIAHIWRELPVGKSSFTHQRPDAHQPHDTQHRLSSTDSTFLDSQASSRRRYRGFAMASETPRSSLGHPSMFGDQYCDLIVISNNYQWGGHRVIVCTASPYLAHHVNNSPRVSHIHHHFNFKDPLLIYATTD